LVLVGLTIEMDMGTPSPAPVSLDQLSGTHDPPASSIVPVAAPMNAGCPAWPAVSTARCLQTTLPRQWNVLRWRP